MSTLWIAAILLATAPADNPQVADTSAPAIADRAGETAAVERGAAAKVNEASRRNQTVEVEKAAEKQEPLTGDQLKKATEDALRRWARCDDKQMASAAGEFLVLYCDLQNDSEIPRATREKLRHKVRYRLLALAPRIAKKTVIDRRLAELAEKKTAEESPSKSLADKKTDNIPPKGAHGGGAYGNDDYGEQLVELIHTTVLPHTWDANGGLGSMYYWRNDRALVVRQSQEAHEQLEHLLLQLRRAGN